MLCADQLGFASPASPTLQHPSPSQHLVEVLGENYTRRKALVTAPIASHISWSVALLRALGEARLLLLGFVSVRSCCFLPLVSTEPAWRVGGCEIYVARKFREA